MGGDGVDPAVRPRLFRGSDQDVDAELARLVAHDQRMAGEILPAQGLEAEQGLGHHVGDDAGVDVLGLQPVEPHELVQPHAVFIRRAFRIG